MAAESDSSSVRSVPPEFIIWIDADACPRPVRDIIFRAAFRLRLPVRLVANCTMPVPAGSLIKSIVVEKGPDVADKYIVDNLTQGDLVITADIPLANAVVKKGCLAIDIRGTLYSEDNIGERCAVRDLLYDLRAEGMHLGGPRPFGPKDKQKFANTFDKIVTRLIREQELKNTCSK